MEEFYGTRYQSGSFPLINVGSGFSLPGCVVFSFSYNFLSQQLISQTMKFPLSSWAYGFIVAGRDQSAVDQPNNLVSKGHAAWHRVIPNCNNCYYFVHMVSWTQIWTVRSRIVQRPVNSSKLALLTWTTVHQSLVEKQKRCVWLKACFIISWTLTTFATVLSNGVPRPKITS